MKLDLNKKIIVHNRFKLFNIDVFRLMKNLPSGIFDLIIIDPPYGTSRKTNYRSGGIRKFDKYILKRKWDFITKKTI